MTRIATARAKRPIPLLLLAVLLLLCGAASAQEDLPLTAQQWLDDLEFVTATLVEKHPNLYYRIGEDRFTRIVSQAKQKIRDGRSSEESLAAIRQVVASIRDGHTALGAGPLQGYNRIFPVRLYEFEDGVFVTAIAREHADYVGARVLTIGRLPAEDALKTAGTLAFADNDFSRMNQAPMILVRCAWAYGLGIVETADEMRLVVETGDGERRELILSAVELTGASNLNRGLDIGPDGIPYVSAMTGTDRELPLYLKHQESNRNYWYEHDEARKTVYMQFNLIQDHEDETFDEFYRRMFAYIDDHPGTVDRFILDVRFNSGGNGLTMIPFINEIIKRDRINSLGRFYTIMGRRSFSAAVLMIAEMMIHTKVLLVGEPAGAAQNMFSDMVNGGTLPNSGATLFLSSEYLNIAWPAGRNFMIPPHYPAPLSSTDFFSGVDPAVEAILSNKARAVGMVLDESGPAAALAYFREIDHDWGVHTDEPGITAFTFPISAKYNGEDRVNSLGYGLMEQDRMDEARAMFELNANLFPDSANAWDSFAECLMKIGDNPGALRYYRKSLELDPHNENAAEAIKKLESRIGQD